MEEIDNTTEVPKSLEIFLNDFTKVFERLSELRRFKKRDMFSDIKTITQNLIEYIRIKLEGSNPRTEMDESAYMSVFAVLSSIICYSSEINLKDTSPDFLKIIKQLSINSAVGPYRTSAIKGRDSTSGKRFF